MILCKQYLAIICKQIIVYSIKTVLQSSIFSLRTIVLLPGRVHGLLVNVFLSHPTSLAESWTTNHIIFQCNAENSAKILHCRRPMKRTFKSHDETHSGLLNVSDFRQVSCIYRIMVRKLQLSNLSFQIDFFLENGTELEHIISFWLLSVTLAVNITHSNLSLIVITIPWGLRSWWDPDYIKQSKTYLSPYTKFKHVSFTNTWQQNTSISLQAALL